MYTNKIKVKLNGYNPNSTVLYLRHLSTVWNNLFLKKNIIFPFIIPRNLCKYLLELLYTDFSVKSKLILSLFQIVKKKKTKKKRFSIFQCFDTTFSSNRSRLTRVMFVRISATYVYTSRQCVIVAT